ncbi:HEAT repeat [Parapedobacter luteus]|uniref:HEAT repeat n=1 Tax=Parapedobacter luteus TaxID=623280 RepID=A0A1T5EZ13_9SPHI|nr:family 16 glycoside hydrolase [Parapedobacter luteus]SKB89177.1 HEAT repeat [Parapedobacter luteus]
MIKSIYPFFVLLILQLPVYAQLDNTPADQKIAALLAKQPAETTDALNEAMAQLERFSESDISALLRQLTPPGKGDNAGVEYAANSYSYHVLTAGKAAQRVTFIKGALAALNAITDNDNKGFVIQLLQNAGDDTAVEALKRYLNDDYLNEKAARALARIGTESAGAALVAALQDATDQSAVNIANALGFMAYKPAEQALLARLHTSDKSLRKAVLYALSRIGGPGTEPFLREAADEVDYVYDATDATAAYVNYAYRLAAIGETATAEKIAARLFRSTKQDYQVHTRIAALRLLTQIDGNKRVNTLVKGAKDDNSIYRNAALTLLVPHLDERTSRQLAKGMFKADESVQVAILRYFGDHRSTSVLPEVRRALDVGTPEVCATAVSTLQKLVGDEATGELIGMLRESDKETRAAIKDALLITENPELPALLTEALAGENDPELQVLLIELLAQKGVGSSVPVIFEIIQGNAPVQVKTAAYQALPQVVRPSDLPDLLDLLPAASSEYASQVQQAAVVSVNRSSNRADQVTAVIARCRKSDMTSRSLFFPVLSGIGGEEALALVAGYADHNDPGMRRAATSALAKWSGAEALPKLIELSRRKVMDSTQRDAVFKGLIRIVGLANIPIEQKVLHLRDLFDSAESVEQRRSVLAALEANKTYNALLFAGKFLDDEQLKATAANTVMNIALENKELYGPDVTRLLTKVMALLSGSESSYLREAIQKHIDELPRDGGYTSLFNGRDLTGWKGLVANPIERASMRPEALAAAQEKADEIMRQGWYVEDGVLHFNGKGDNVATVGQYANFELWVDWKLAKEGKEGDAGIYLRGTPQVQIWDTSRVDVGAQVGSGGLYNNERNPRDPLKVADNPLGEWNTFRIIMVDDRVTVYLNGELVTDNVVLENYWNRTLPIFPMEQIELQAHGTHVSYRDIHLRELP